MALAAGGGETRKGNRTGMAGMTLRTSPDCSVVIGLADGVALFTTRCGGGVSFRKHQRIRRPFSASRLKLLTECDLLRLRPFSP